MYKALLELFKQNKDSYTIVETGVAAHGTRSTLFSINIGRVSI